MPTPRVRRLDRDNDSTFGKGAANYASGSESTEQRLLCALRLILGEAFLDTGRGIPWVQAEDSDVRPILGVKPSDPGAAEAIVKATILGVEGIESISSFSMALNTSTRGASITAKVFDVDGEPILLQQFDPLLVGP
jgi:hypothetical protein